MSIDLRDQLAEYGRHLESAQRPVGLDEVVPPEDVVRPVPLTAAGERRQWWRNALVAVGAASAVVLLIGAVALLVRSQTVEPADQTTVTSLPPTTVTTLPSETTVTTVPDQPTVTTIPSPTSTEAAVLGPGSWSVAATGGATPLDELVGEVATWPGVIEVVAVPDQEGWLGLTGLDCTEVEGLPCDPGVVAVAVDAWMAQTALRLEADHGMSAFTAQEAPQAFWDGYSAAVLDRSSPAPLRFDPAPLGEELQLEGPHLNTGETCVSCDAQIRLAVDGFLYHVWVEAFADDSSAFVLDMTGGGTGFEVADLLFGRDGRRGVLADLRAELGGRRVYGFAGLPHDAAVITFVLADGTQVWQRPLAGMALIVDAPRSADPNAEERDPPQDPFIVLDADGTEIMLINGIDHRALVTDLRIDQESVAATSGPAAATTDPSFDLATSEFATEVGNVYTTRFGGGFVETGDAIWVKTLEGGDQSSIVRIDITTGATERIPATGLVGKLVPTQDALWAIGFDTGSVLRIDPAAREVTDTIEIPGAVQTTSDIMSAGGGLWVSSYETGYTRIDLTTRSVETYPLPVGINDGMWVGVIDGALWSYDDNAAWGHGSSLIRIDLATREFEQYDLAFGGSPESRAVLTDDAIWLIHGDGSVARFDLQSRELTDRLNLGRGSGSGGVFVDGGVWIPNGGQGTVTRVESATAEVTDVIAVEPSPGPLVVDADGGLWMAHFDYAKVSRIDSTSRQLTHVIEVSSGGALLAFDEAVWVASRDGTITRIATR